MTRYLFDLPTDLAATIVSKWLSIPETTRLDSACCDSASRTRFANILSNSTLRYPIFCHKPTDDLLIWSLKRDVRVDKLYISKESDLAIYKEYLLERGRTVTTIGYHANSFRGVGMEFIAAIATYCPNLECFDLAAYKECPGLDALLRDILVNCKQLKDLSIAAECFAEREHPSLQGISCPRLGKLFFNEIRSGEMIAALLKMAPNLTSLCLRACNCELINGESALQFVSSKIDHLYAAELTDDELICIVDKCPHITSVSLCDPQYESRGLTVRSIEHMVKQLKLKEIDLNYGYFTGECIFAIAYYCAETLTSFEMMYFNETVPLINELLRRCTKLTRFRCHENRLNYSLLGNITELHLVVHRHQAFLADIALHCKKLVHLELYDLGELLAPEDLDSIMANCAHIRTLTMTRSVELDPSRYLSSEKKEEWTAVRSRLVVTETKYSVYP